VFPSNLSSTARFFIHQFAGAVGLDHVSQGQPPNRSIRISKPPATPQGEQDEQQQQHVESTCSGTAAETTTINEQLVHHGFIGLQGELVDAHAFRLMRDNAELIPAEYCQKRVNRDGHRHHITIITKNEVLGMLQERGVKATVILQELQVGSCHGSNACCNRMLSLLWHCVCV
jgi:hypothetical protein